MINRDFTEFGIPSPPNGPDTGIIQLLNWLADAQWEILSRLEKINGEGCRRCVEVQELVDKHIAEGHVVSGNAARGNDLNRKAQGAISDYVTAGD